MTLTMHDRDVAKAPSLRAETVELPYCTKRKVRKPAQLTDQDSPWIDGELYQARSLAKKFPKSPIALARLANRELSFDNRLSAMKAAKAAMALSEIHVPSLYYVSRVFERIGEIDLAESALQKVLDSATVSILGKQTAAFFAASLAASIGKTDKALRLLQYCKRDRESLFSFAQSLKGDLLIEQGRYEEAITAFRASLSENPDSPDTLSNLGFAYAVVGSLRKAIHATTAAAAIDPLDRCIGRNLTTLHILCGQKREAVTSISRLAGHHPLDLDLMLDMAEVMRATGDNARARHHLHKLKLIPKMVNAGPVIQAKLDLSLKLTEQPIAYAQAFSAALHALEQCDYNSKRIARIFTSAAQGVDNLAAIESSYGRLLAHQSRESLLGIESRLALLKFDFSQCLETTKEWLECEPFSADAFVAATYLNTLFAGKHKVAAELGRVGIARGIRSSTLANNTAFALAMDGELDKASRRLPKISDFKQALSTAGLIEMLRGNVERGIAMYEECKEQTRKAGDSTMADLVEMHQVLAEAVVGRTITEDRLKAFARQTKSDPRFAITNIAIRREIQRHAQ